MARVPAENRYGLAARPADPGAKPERQPSSRMHAVLATFAVFAVLSTLLAGLAYSGYRVAEAQRLDIIRAREKGYLALSVQQIRRAMFEPLADLNFAAQLPVVRNFLNSPTPENRALVARAFLAMSQSYGRYDKVRFIGNDGMEIIRISRQHNESSVTPDHELQNKADRYFFKAAMALGDKQTYVSPMDLNMEQGKIEVPLNPTIRFAKRLFDSAGNSKGVMVLNYSARELLAPLKAVDSGAAADALHIAMLTDVDGYWLSNGYAPELEFGLALGNTAHVFANRFPNVWEQMQQQQSGSTINNEGMFLFETIYPLADAPAADSGTAAKSLSDNGISAQTAQTYQWKLVLWLPPASLMKTSLSKQIFSWQVLSVFFVLTALASIGIAQLMLGRKALRQRRALHLSELAKQAHTDPLTGVANRRRFNELARQEMARIQRNPAPLCLLMLDIDHFKRINDTYGHEAGDKVLQAFAAVCSGMLREIDVFARLGGEEFAALLPNTSLGQAEQIAKRICDRLASAPVAVEQKLAIEVTVSIGVSQLGGSVTDLEAMLRAADGALYAAKTGGRNRTVCA
ncbi:hypothetical protein A1507_02950 [Methylomonas koyamae]|uniref:diguanylate cyclase n=1 Tax=Methylomonas koyamae TaxID=702114 RepID=A0A177N3N5_9GAMM|nr:diguanylate cyclase [Methylomonas koyamae]OAI12455.1 hypothetical protein A1507_02950 [Methylomonas koyamae]